MPKNYRKLISGRKVKEENRNRRLVINTKCPEKWLFVDLQDGNVWHSTGVTKKYPQWRTPTVEEIKELRNISKKEYWFVGVSSKGLKVANK